MPPNEEWPGPRRKGPGRDDRHPDMSNDARSRANVARGMASVVELSDWRQFCAWVAAAEHLNALGCPAAVPLPLVASLHRRGLVVWPSASGRAA